ncbi:MAG TPA: YdgA family protein [Steroidobacteraceae bacterium]|nr:YdgA family protein [Steroidobacteraceae bacterium]
MPGLHEWAQRAQVATAGTELGSGFGYKAPVRTNVQYSSGNKRMKKNVLIVPVVLGVAAGAYAIAAWQFGRMTHARVDEWAQHVNEKSAGILKVVNRQSAGGVFFSREDLTIEVDTAMFDKLKGSTPDSEQVEAPSDADEPSLSDASLRTTATHDANHPLRFTVRNDIAHGPFPGFTSVGLAKITSRLVLDEQTRRELSKVLGDKEPVLITSIVGVSGASAIDVASPAFQAVEGNDSFEWQGLNAHFDVGADLQTIKCDGAAPGLTAKSKDRSQVSLGEMRFSCDMKRAFDQLYVGRSAFAFQNLNATFGEGKPPVAIESIAYSGDATVNGEYVDLNMKLMMKALKAAGFTVDDAEYNLSMLHLHGPTYAALSKKLQDLSTSGALGDPTASLAMMGAIAEYGPQLLEHSPKIVIERIGFSMPEGEAGLKGTIELKNFSKADLAEANSTMVLLNKLEATADLWIGDGLLEKDWGSSAVESSASNTDRIGALRAQVSSLETQGFITHKDGELASHIEYKNGALTANGHQIGPAAGAN